MSDSCNPMDCSLLGSSVHGILQARILKELPFPSLEDLPDSGIEPGCPVLQADSLPTELLEWIDISFSRGSSRLRDQTHTSFISCIGRQISTTASPGKPPCLF